MRPVAVIGTGPCIRDIHSGATLLENRVVLAMAGAVEIFPEAHIVFLHDVVTVNNLVSKVRPGRALVLTWSSVLHEKLTPKSKEAIWMHRPKEITDTERGCGTLPQVLRYLARTKAESVELYGVDLDGPGYENQLKHLSGHQYPFTIQNCCPSSKLTLYPKLEVPWTSPGR